VKKIRIIAPYPKGEAPSQRFRFEQYLELLEKDGYQIEYHSFIDEKTWEKLYLPGNYFFKVTSILKSFVRRWLLLFSIKKNDLIFIHREMAHIGPPIFEWILAKVLRKKYIYDFDDAIWLPNYSQSNAKFQRLKAYWKVNYCMKWAYRISAGNQYLANYASQFNSNVFIIPTTIDLLHHHTLQTDYEKKDIVIGWTGTLTTMHYLDFLIPILEELEQDFEFTFLVISNQEPSFKLNSLKFVKWEKDSEIEDLAQISIGVMPLYEDIWSKGKCGFKGLQYMALGIPSLMSPVGVNTEIVEHGKNGFLPNSQEEWKDTLKELLVNKDLRSRIGNEGLKTIQEKYSVRANYPKYKALLTF
jgi:glycosyltransferase involved in cell wall biosynthesis